MIIDILTEKQLTAVECEACHDLHRFTSGSWVAIFGAWQLGQQAPRGPFIGKAFGTHDRPSIACNKTACILQVMGRGSNDTY